MFTRRDIQRALKTPRRGAALVIVLGMLVLLLGLILAFLASSGINRQTSVSSANLTAVELLTTLAQNNIIGGLQREIRNSTHSIEYTAPNTLPLPGEDRVTLFLPRTPADAVPELELNGLTATDLIGNGMENLLKVSTNSNSTPTDAKSLNGRQLTPERWNKPLLMQRAQPNGSDDSPPSNFPVPEWILVARDGSNPATINDARWDRDMNSRDTVVGRYAYVVYNQGGLLDANIAGYPASADAGADLDGDASADIADPVGFKPSSAYADLTIPEIGLDPAEINTWIEGWRNQATFNATDPAAEYFKLNLRNQSGFLSPSNTAATAGVTDRMFISRQQLITFFEDKLGGKNTDLMDTLQYFSTFSRSLNQPTFYRMQGQDISLPNYNSNAPQVSTNWETVRINNNNPAPDYWANPSDRGNSANGQDAIVNPIIPSITMKGTGTEPRIDGSSIREGDPVLNKRFPLDRLLWVTYKGPSEKLGSTDPLVAALKKEGITQDQLDQGTAKNIEKAFGLRWVGPNGNSTDYNIGGHWIYDAHSSANPIDILEVVADENREPDFFEILKATVDVGAIGRARKGFQADSRNEPVYLDQIRMDSFINNQIFQIGANMIDQVHPENYPTHIVVPNQAGMVRNTALSFWGTVDLPYLYGTTFGTVLVASPAVPPTNPDSPDLEPALPALAGVLVGEITADTGAFVNLQFPILWNPHGQRASALPPSLTPQNFRICVTSSQMAIPSEIGDPSPIGGNSIEKFNPAIPADMRDDGGRTAVDGTMRQFVQPDWQSNASGVDAVSMGVIRFAANDPTALIFDVNDPALFRQPTPLMRPNIPAAINLRVESNHQLGNVNLGTLGTGTWTSGVPEVGSGERYFGFYAGRFPVRYLRNSTETATARSIQVEQLHGGFTYSLEYTTDGGTTWFPYKQVVTPIRTTATGRDTVSAPWEYNASSSVLHAVNRTSLVNRWQIVLDSSVNERWPSSDPCRFFLDPRTSRWSADGKMPQPGFSPNPASGVLSSLRPGTALGGPRTSVDVRDGGAMSKTSMIMDHRDLFYEASHWFRNLLGPSNHVPFYDADNVLRRPMGAWVPDTTSENASTAIGLPLADGGASTEGANPNRFNRPLILHRPFRSVAELSYTFSDAPWRNIDFFTPESGFTGLLDVFSVSDNQRTDSVVAGKVDLNTRQMPVLKSLLAGGYRDTLDENMPEIPDNVAEALAEALIQRTTSSDPGQGPLWNLAHLVGRFDAVVDTQATSPSTQPVRFDGFSADLGVASGANTPEAIVQRLREAPIRVLSQTGQAGTWNLLVDVVAQSGRYPASATSLNNFLVEAEKRVWLHLAIDRLTGNLIDYEIEVITE